MKVLIAICTYNPNYNRLERVLTCIKNNEYPHRILIVENGITTPGCRELAKKFNAKYYLEPRIGTARARMAAMKFVNPDELLIFVDDDNYLTSNYIVKAVETKSENPDWGMFAGKLEVPVDYKINITMVDFLPFLAVRDLGNSKLEADASLEWNKLEPPTAGACLDYRLVRHMIKEFDSEFSTFFTIGAKGGKQFRGEDSFIARQCLYLSMKWGYAPELSLLHDFGRSRLRLRYLSKLLFSMGRSDVLLDFALKIKPAYPYPENIIRLLAEFMYYTTKSRLGWILGLRRVGIYFQYKLSMRNASR